MSRTLAWCTVPLLLLQCLGLDPSMVLGWVTLAMVLVSSFKLLEARRSVEFRLVALLQLIAVGLLAAQSPGLLASLLQLLSALLALASLLAVDVIGVSRVRVLLLRSLQLMAAALPLALMLFLLLPRIGPLWGSDLVGSARARTGLSPDLDPLGITELVRSDAPAARLSLGENREPPDDAYWRVLVHTHFDGTRWQRRPSARSERFLDQTLAMSSTAGQQWWTVEPSPSDAVPWDGRSRPTSPELQLDALGELRLRQPPAQQRVYRLQELNDSAPWRQQPATPTDLELPRGRQPKLEALAATWRTLPNDQARLAAAEDWFRQQPFTYSLQPGVVRSGSLDEFLFQTQVGFCGHYASALSVLMRAAGVPSRVVSGYRGGRLIRPLSGSPYLDIRQSEAHAWSEVWLDGRGWSRVDPTTWVDRVDASARPWSEGAAGAMSAPWWRWLQWQWWGIDLAWTQWWLGWNQVGQQELLQRLLAWAGDWTGLIVLLGAGVAGAIGLLILRWLRRAPVADPLQRSLFLLARLGAVPAPGETFPQLCRRAASLKPELSGLLDAMAQQQQLLAHAQLCRSEQRHHSRLWRQLRGTLARRLKAMQ